MLCFTSILSSVQALAVTCTLVLPPVPNTPRADYLAEMDHISAPCFLSVNQTAFSALLHRNFSSCFSPLLLSTATVMLILHLVLQQEELFLDLPNPFSRMSLVSKWTPPVMHFSSIPWLILKDKQHMKLLSVLSPTFPSQLPLFSHSSDLWIHHLHSVMKLGTSESFPSSLKLWWVLMIKATFRLLGFLQQLRALKCPFFAWNGCSEWVNFLISFFSQDLLSRCWEVMSYASEGRHRE